MHLDRHRVDSSSEAPGVVAEGLHGDSSGVQTALGEHGGVRLHRCSQLELNAVVLSTRHLNKVTVLKTRSHSLSLSLLNGVETGEQEHLLTLYLQRAAGPSSTDAHLL